jgi:hypothetical protein
MIAFDTFILQAVAARDAMAKCLYGALFDWIVLQINTTMLSKNTNRQHQVLCFLLRVFRVLTVLSHPKLTVLADERFISAVKTKVVRKCSFCAFIFWNAYRCVLISTDERRTGTAL